MSGGRNGEAGLRQSAEVGEESMDIIRSRQDGSENLNNFLGP